MYMGVCTAMCTQLAMLTKVGAENAKRKTQKKMEWNENKDK